jgi:hypothetical protein
MRILLASALFAHVIAQQLIANPINDFCRRHQHQTCVIDNKLYVDGGLIYYGADASRDNPQPSELFNRVTDSTNVMQINGWSVRICHN